MLVSLPAQHLHTMFTVPIARVVTATSWLCLSLTHAQYVQFLHCMHLFAAGVRDNNGQSPLDCALDSNFSLGSCLDVALYLISRGCGGAEDRNKLMTRACEKGKLDVVKELVEQHKVDPNSEFSYVYTL